MSTARPARDAVRDAARDAVRDAFLAAAAPPRDAHTAGTLDEAQALLNADPALGTDTIHGAAVTGHADAAAALLAADRALAVQRSGPDGWDPLTMLCFSRFLRHDRARGHRFTRTAALLLHAGADARTGFLDPTHAPHPTFASALYGAAGVAHHAPVTRLLLAHGADPNDEEVAYHVADADDPAVLEAILDSGRCTADTLATLLLRAADWQNEDSVRRLLAYGADPNHSGRWPYPPLFHAIRRGNALGIIDALLAHGADPRQVVGDGDATSLAAAHGRADVLARLAAMGVTRPRTGDA